MRRVLKWYLRRHPAFTLVEVVLVTVLLVSVSALVVPVTESFRVGRMLDIAAHDVQQALTQAREQATAGKNDSAWGVKFDQDTFTIFAGDSYAARNQAYDDIRLLPQRFAFTGLDEVVFSKLSGLTPTSGLVTIVYLPTTKTSSVTVSPGLLVWITSSSSSSTSLSVSSSTSSAAAPSSGSAVTSSAVSSSSSVLTGGTGSGTPSDPYTVATCQQLQNMSNNLTASYVLVADVDCGVAPFNSGAGFMPIGQVSDSTTNLFQGSFDGAGHRILNLTINRPAAVYVGLFGHAYKATFKNVTLENVTITGKSLVGSLYGRDAGLTTVLNVRVTTGTLTANATVGGLVGYVSGGTNLSDCSAGVTVRTNAPASQVPTWFGGLAGYSSGTITRCYATGNVLVFSGSHSVGPSTQQVGGLVGYNQGAISTSYAMGSVSGDQYVGGLVGYAPSGSVANSYATGPASGYLRVSGLVGYGAGSVSRTYAAGHVTAAAGASWDCGLVCNAAGLSVSYSYYDQTTTGQNDTAYGTPETTAQMKQEATFSGWNFTNIWSIAEGVAYPALR